MNYRFDHIDHLTNDEILELYIEASKHGVADIVFYDKDINCPITWFEYLKRTKAWLVRVVDENEEIAFFWWLTDFQGKTACIHFCNWKLTKDECVEASKQSLKWLYDLGHFKSLWGCTPKIYRHVFPYIKAIGFEVVGEMQEVCYMVRKGKYLDAKISLLNLKKVYG